jgi:hypothetical protein
METTVPRGAGARINQTGHVSHDDNVSERNHRPSPRRKNTNSCTWTFQEIATNQNRIGWMTIFRGFWSNKWLEAHIAHLAEVPMRDQTDQEKKSKHQDRWLNTVSRLVMKQCHKLWIRRNNDCHGVTPAEKAAALRTTAERELKKTL